MRRYYALLIGNDGMARLVREYDGRTVLAEVPFQVDAERRYRLELEVEVTHLAASIDGIALLEADIPGDPIRGGGAGLVVSEGTLSAGSVNIERVR